MHAQMTEPGHPSPTRRAAIRPLHLAYVGACAGVLGVGVLVGGTAEALGLGVVGLLATVALLGAARRLPRVGTNPWLCLATATACWTSAIVVGLFARRSGATQPAVVDLMFLAGYLATGTAFLLVARVRASTASRAAFLDGAVLGVAAATVLWVGFVAPNIHASLDPLHRTTQALLPWCDGVLVAIICWVFLVPGRREPALLLLVGALGLMLGTDVVADALGHTGSGVVTTLPMVRLLAVSGLGAAALVAPHELLTAEAVRRGRAEHVHRSLLMGVALLVVPVSAVVADLGTTEGTVVISVSAALLAVGVIARFVTLVHQIERAHDETARSERRFRMLADSAPVGIYELGRGTQVTYANAEAQRLLGARMSGLTVDAMTDHVDPSSRASLRRALEALHQGESSTADLRLSPTEPERWVTWQSVPVPADDDSSPIAFASTVDISDLKMAEAALARQATHDPLTGLPNRRHLLESLIEALSSLGRGPRTGTVALMFIDLDGFKLVNDVLGHDRGDLLLKTASSRIRNAVRAHDIVARFGGDEFVVLLEHVSDRGELHDVAQRILDALTAPIVIDGDPADVGASIGITIATGPDDDPDALIRNADAAMYRAKEHGRGRYEFYRPDARPEPHRML
jgi:diguanylate cyclase (GGDEF)-like protein/PAS domain S-box-containing protein